MEGYDRIAAFAVERESVRVLKEAGATFPYSSDPIISGNRFCNVRREDDRVTRWVAENWRNEDRHNWFAMAVARLALNRIGTMRELGYPVPWDPSRFLSTVSGRIARGEPVYGQAYMIIPPTYQGPKAEGLVRNLLQPLWDNREYYAPRGYDTLQSFFDRLVSAKGVGSFTAGQVVADVKHGSYLSGTTDWWDWASPGPGSRRGLNRVIGRHHDTGWMKGEWEETLKPLVSHMSSVLGRIDAQDVQNCLCEFDKYERVRLGQGKAKQRYAPGVVRDS